MRRETVAVDRDRIFGARPPLANAERRAKRTGLTVELRPALLCRVSMSRKYYWDRVWGAYQDGRLVGVLMRHGRRGVRWCDFDFVLIATVLDVEK
jgi:hypothetical protein